MENPKYVLEQFYCYMPVYNSRRVGNGAWKVSLTLKNGEQFEMDHQGKVRDAEEELASQALMHLTKMDRKKIVEKLKNDSIGLADKIIAKQQILILIDLVTVPNALSLANYIGEDSKVKIIGFTADPTIMLTPIPNIKKQFIKSKRKGAVAVTMTMHIMSSIPDRLIIISTDKIVTTMQELFTNCGVNIVIFKDFLHCLQILRPISA